MDAEQGFNPEAERAAREMEAQRLAALKAEATELEAQAAAEAAAVAAEEVKEPTPPHYTGGKQSLWKKGLKGLALAVGLAVAGEAEANPAPDAAKKQLEKRHAVEQALAVKDAAEQAAPPKTKQPLHVQIDELQLDTAPPVHHATSAPHHDKAIKPHHKHGKELKHSKKHHLEVKKPVAHKKEKAKPQPQEKHLQYDSKDLATKQWLADRINKKGLEDAVKQLGFSVDSTVRIHTMKDVDGSQVAILITDGGKTVRSVGTAGSSTESFHAALAKLTDKDAADVEFTDAGRKIDLALDKDIAISIDDYGNDTTLLGSIRFYKTDKEKGVQSNVNVMGLSIRALYNRFVEPNEQNGGNAIQQHRAAASPLRLLYTDGLILSRAHDGTEAYTILKEAFANELKKFEATYGKIKHGFPGLDTVVKPNVLDAKPAPQAERKEKKITSPLTPDLATPLRFTAKKEPIDPGEQLTYGEGESKMWTEKYQAKIKRIVSKNGYSPQSEVQVVGNKSFNGETVEVAITDGKHTMRSQGFDPTNRERAVEQALEKFIHPSPGVENADAQVGPHASK